MKNLGLIILFSLLLNPLVGQKKIILHKTDLSSQGFAISRIDSLKFSNNETVVDIYKHDNTITSFLLSNIDSITVGEILPQDFPVIKTNKATSISYITTVSGVFIKSTGISAITEKGICWSTSENPTIDNSKIISASIADSSSVNITGLNANTTYFVRAYAINDAGISYGEQITFTTLSYSLPTSEILTTSYNYSTNNAIIKARINSNGGCTLTERGICWSTTNLLPTVTDSKYKESGTAVGQYFSLMTGLSVNTIYYIRSYAINCLGTISYGNMVKLTPTTGNVTFTLGIDSASNPEPYRLIKIAMDSACKYYNRYTTFSGNIYVYYNTGIPTAQASYHGSIGFGSNTWYMHVATAMHEMAHFFGSGTTTSWQNFAVGGIFQGQTASSLLLSLTGEILKCDNNSNPIHFWPYGLNQRSEATSESVYVNHCKIVNAMKTDCGWPNP